jgi:hypothetical protein
MTLSTFFSVLPTWVLFIFTVGGSVTLACIAMALRSRVKLPEDSTHNEATGFMFATVSVVYAVLLAFLVIAVWEKLGSLDTAVSNESAAIMAVARDAAALPEPLRKDILNQLHSYTDLVITSDWPTIIHIGHQDTTKSLPASIQLNKLWLLCGQKLPSQPISDNIINNLNVISQQRVLRFTLQREGLSDSLWLVLLAGAIIVIYLGVALNVKSRGHHILLILLLACTIGLCMWLIADIDNPFAGTVQVGTDTFEHALQVINAVSQ